MSYANVTSSTAKDDNIVDLLKKPFYVQPSGEQNIIVKQRLMPNLQETTKDRSFQQSWYAKKDLLCGSVSKKAMFCWPCLLFCPGKSTSWTMTGFNNMKSISSDWKKYEKAKSHMGAYKTWRTYGTGPRVDSLYASCAVNVEAGSRSTAALKADVHWMQIVARSTFCSHFP